MRTLIAWILTWAAIASLVTQAPLVAYAQSPVVVTVDECRNLSDTDVRDRIRDLASTSLKAELTAIDYAALVNTYWSKAGVETRIDQEIDDAVAFVRSDTTWADRAYSTVSERHRLIAPHIDGLMLGVLRLGNDLLSQITAEVHRVIPLP